MLYVYIIQQSSSPVDTYEDYFIAATRCQNHLSNVAKEGSLAARYCLILGDLRTQVLRQAEQLQDHADGPEAANTEFFTELNSNSLSVHPQIPNIADFEVAASEQFNPMVSLLSVWRICRCKTDAYKSVYRSLQPLEA